MELQTDKKGARERRIRLVNGKLFVFKSADSTMRMPVAQLDLRDYTVSVSDDGRVRLILKKGHTGTQKLPVAFINFNEVTVSLEWLQWLQEAAAA